MGYVGIGPISESVEGIWNPILVPDPPKRGSKPIIGLSNETEDDSSRKEKKHYNFSSECHPNTIFFKSSNPTVVDPSGTGTSTSMDETYAKKNFKKI